MNRTIAICVATYRRKAMLRRLLASLRHCVTPPGATVELRVVDNDSTGSGRKVCEEIGAQEGWTLRYEVEPRRSIANARNAAVEMGGADIFMFIDDDEVPTATWMTELESALNSRCADAVVGPVRGVCPPGTPEWITRGVFFDKPTAPAGKAMHWRGGRTSNTAIRGTWFGTHGLRFNADFGLSGGEDTELFLQMSLRGARFAGAERAVLTEDIEPDRVNFRWLWRRHVRGGRNYRRLSDLAGGRRHELVLLGARTVRGMWRVLSGLPRLLAGRPERAISGLLLFGVAFGGLEAWLFPARSKQHCAYAARPMGIPA